MFRTKYITSFGSIFTPRYVRSLRTLKIEIDSEETIESENISLPFSSPCTIEWSETEKEDVVQGSTCQLRVICESDRQFLWLYELDPGKVRLSIDAPNTSGIWIGTLDTETYEEPYSTDEGYVTTLTFTDFGYLDRVDFDMKGIKSINDILIEAIKIAHINSNGLSYYSTSFTTDDHDMEDIKINCSNFYDEDGNPMTWKEVITSILQPFACHIIQKMKVFYVYDYNHIAVDADRTIQWMSNDQTLSLDKYVNKIVVSLSCYTDDKLTDEELTLPFDFSSHKNKTNFGNSTIDFPTGLKPCRYYSWYNSKNATEISQNLVAFTLFDMSDLTDVQKGVINVTYDSQLCHPFYISPIGGGEEASGFISQFMTPKNGRNILASEYSITDDVLFEVKCEGVTSLKHPESYNLELTMEMLASYRYNPFNDSDDDNDPDGLSGTFKYYAHCFKPILMELLNDDGEVIYRYSNALYLNAICNSTMNGWRRGYWFPPDYESENWRNSYSWSDLPETNLGTAQPWKLDWRSKGNWYSVDDNRFSDIDQWCWLDYCDYSSFRTSSGEQLIKTGCSTLSFRKNSHNLGSCVYGTTYTNKVAEGQKIPYPPVGGTIRIKVLKGFAMHGNKCPFDVRSTVMYPQAKRGVSSEKYRWVAYKTPQLKIVKNTQYYDSAEFDDIEVSCHVNDYASDTLQVSLTSGTGDVEMPTAKASLLHPTTQRPLIAIKRNGIEGSAETLLAGTLYSQYYGRKIKLTGTCSSELGFYSYGDASSPGKVFAETACSLDLKTGLQNATFVEVKEDNYEEDK